jgi:hypothetical protein
MFVLVLWRSDICLGSDLGMASDPASKPCFGVDFGEEFEGGVVEEVGMWKRDVARGEVRMGEAVRTRVFWSSAISLRHQLVLIPSPNELIV